MVESCLLVTEELNGEMMTMMTGMMMTGMMMLIEMMTKNKVQYCRRMTVVNTDVARSHQNHRRIFL